MLPQDEKTVNKFDKVLSTLHRAKKQAFEDIEYLKDYIQQLDNHLLELEHQPSPRNCPFCYCFMKDVSKIIQSNIPIRHPFGSNDIGTYLSYYELSFVGLICLNCGLFETQIPNDTSFEWDRSSPGAYSSLANIILRNYENIDKINGVRINGVINYAFLIDDTWFTYGGEVTKDNLLSKLQIEPKKKKVNQETQERPGYIYLLLGMTENKPYKIGRSKTPEQRTEWIGLKVPFETVVCHIFYADDMYLAESELHNRFSDKRQEGEWFNLTDEDTRYILSIEEYRDGDFIKR